jgi:prepilin-type N-terminal cleavage/methylation domain-containing protein
MVMQRNRLNTRKAGQGRRSAAGFTLLEVIVALIVIVSLLSVAAVWLGRYNDRIANELVAGQMRRIGNAVKQYVDDNAAQLSKGSTPARIPWDKVKPYLPPGLDQNTVNPLGQTYEGRLRVVTLPNGGKRVDTMIYTVGSTNIATHARKIAALIGAGGLYVDWNRSNGVTGNKLTYWTADGQVSDPADLDKFWLGGRLTSGDLGLIMYVPSVGDEASDAPDLAGLLHRKAVAGHPEWNRMETDIDMNTSGLNNVGAVNFKGGSGEVTGVKRIQFEKTGRTAPVVSLAASAGGWLTVGDPQGKRTNFWANEIEADGRLVVHADSVVDGNSSVRGNSSVSGNQSVGGAVSAGSLTTTGEIYAGTNVTIMHGDLVFPNDPVRADAPCDGMHRINMSQEGDLMVCKNRKWTAVGTAFTHGYGGDKHIVTGELTSDNYYETSRYGAAQEAPSRGIAAIGSVRTARIRNKLAWPALMSVSQRGPADYDKSRCYLAVYEANNSGYTDQYDPPIAIDQRALHHRYGDNSHYYNTNDTCFVTFMAKPGASYNVVYHWSGDSRINVGYSY